MDTLFKIAKYFLNLFGINPAQYRIFRQLKYRIVKDRFNPEHKRIIKQYVKKGSWVIDVGANKGDYSALFLKCGAERVDAFEPGMIFRQLYERFAYHPKMYLHCYALGVCTQEIILYECADNGKTSAIEPLFPDVLMKHKVQCKKLDEFTEFKPNFIKIDAEGMDYEILLGAKRILKIYQPIVLVEYNGKTFFNMICFMDDLGYNQQGVYYGDTILDILFVPRGKK